MLGYMFPVQELGYSCITDAYYVPVFNSRPIYLLYAILIFGVDDCPAFVKASVIIIVCFLIQTDRLCFVISSAFVCVCF